MNGDRNTGAEREHDFALIVSGVDALTGGVEDALFGAGCDDATLSMRYGMLYLEFSRVAPGLKDAILSAIRDIRRSGLGIRVLRVDECRLVTGSEIARRIGRSRQLIHQYMTGVRGPGGFPAPVCHLGDRAAPVWSWCAVCHWLCENQLMRQEDCADAEVVEAINAALEESHQSARLAALVDQMARELRAIGA